jgi:hypothetical protein
MNESDKFCRTQTQLREKKVEREDKKRSREIHKRLDFLSFVLNQKADKE